MLAKLNITKTVRSKDDWILNQKIKVKGAFGVYGWERKMHQLLEREDREEMGLEKGPHLRTLHGNGETTRHFRKFRF